MQKDWAAGYIGIKNSMNKALRIYTDYKENDLEEIGKSVVIVRDTLELLTGIPMLCAYIFLIRQCPSQSDNDTPIRITKYPQI